jgi:uncharacterized protein (DUF1800 family)
MHPTSLPPLDEVDPQKAWQPWQPDAAQPWDLKWAGHLYRRAGFGATRAELSDAVRQGLPATLDRLLHGEPGAEERQRFLAEIGGGLARKQNASELRGWWLYCMRHSLHPLREKLTLFWHNHFATSNAKVQQTVLMFNQNQLLRRHALGKFGPFLLAVSRDPAMLVWLDANNNRKGHPNENYARELMELFSLGVGHYTEQDVREAARAFTGWHTDDEAFAFNQLLHDDGDKTVLGQKGNWNGDDVVRIVLEQPAAAGFLVRKLYRFFISEAADPPAALLKPLADSFRASDYDLGALVTTMLRSRHFFSGYANRQRVKSPVELVLGTAWALLASTVSPLTLIRQLEAMGQQLFAPPNVKGWEGGQSWLNTATVLARHNFAERLVGGRFGELIAASDWSAGEANAAVGGPDQTVSALVDLLLQGGIQEAARGKLVAFLADGAPQGKDLNGRVREAVHAILTMPEYQLA